MYAWLTPDNQPDSNICITISCPNSIEWFSCVWGALSMLADAENWEKYGTLTPEEVAEVFLQRYEKTIQWGRCVHIGSVFFHAGSSVPQGALVADGSLYSAVDYPNLYDVIGNQYGGVGNTFAVPNLTNRAAIGSGGDYVLGDTGGEKTHKLTESEMPRHNHAWGNLGPILAVVPGEAIAYAPIPPTFFTGDKGGDGHHNNMQPYIGLLPCIQAE
jgi:microcystin-dependent protein